MTMRSQRGFVAVEWVAAVALLLVPIIVLIAMLPTWAERRAAASLAAAEAAKVLADAWPHGDAVVATVAARAVAQDHGVDAADVSVQIDSFGRERGDDVRVRVSVRMPAVSVIGVRAGEWRYDAFATRRIDDYRSR
jgi:pyruvate/2-oxoglutarate dehydrogenase complex dihydrolipoamide acyltransferase (E2) component